MVNNLQEEDLCSNPDFMSCMLRVRHSYDVRHKRMIREADIGGPGAALSFYDADTSREQFHLFKRMADMAKDAGYKSFSDRYSRDAEKILEERKNSGRFSEAGYVNMDLHNHLATSDDMSGLLERLLHRVVKTRFTPSIIGVVDFNNFGEKSRFAQLVRQADGNAYNFGNSLYFPLEDVMLVKGQEVPTREGHLLVMGLEKDSFIKPGMPLDYSLDEAKSLDAITIVDHPFSPDGGLGNIIAQNRGKYLNMFDAWEVYNSEAALFPGANRKALDYYNDRIENQYSVSALSGSDGHSIREIGRSYTGAMIQAYDSLRNGEDVRNMLRDALISGSELRQDVKRPAIMGATKHMAELAAIIGLSKVGLYK